MNNLLPQLLGVLPADKPRLCFLNSSSSVESTHFLNFHKVNWDVQWNCIPVRLIPVLIFASLFPLQRIFIPIILSNNPPAFISESNSQAFQSVIEYLKNNKEFTKIWTIAYVGDTIGQLFFFFLMTSYWKVSSNSLLLPSGYVLWFAWQK